jgi:RHS repeat-associated protein
VAAPTANEAQETSQFDKGTPPQQAAGVSSLGSYMSTDLGTVNLSNGALNFRIPLGTVGGRGFSVPLTLNYSSKVWSATKGQDYYGDPYYTNYPAAYAVYNDPKGGGGWHLGAAPIISAQGVGITAQACPGTSCGGYLKGLTKLTIKLPDKGEVELRDDLYDGAPLGTSPDGSGIARLDGNRGQRWHATDGSGTIFISDNANGVVKGDLNGLLITGDGTRYRFQMTYAGTPMTLNMSVAARCYSITDRNGNQISISYPSSTETRFTDQLGRITKVQYEAPDPANAGITLAVLITFPGYGGTTQGPVRYFKLKAGVMNQHYRSDVNPVLPVINGDHDPRGNGYSWGTATRLFPQSDGAGAERIDNQTVYTELVLPDNRSLRFRYNEYGEVAEVETPTGGRVRYDYAYDGQLPSGNSLAIETKTTHRMLTDVSDVDRAVVARRTYANGTTTTAEASWSYDYKPQAAPNGVTYPCTEVRATSAAGTLLLSQRHLFMAAQRYINTSSGEGTGYSLWSTGVEWRTETRDAGNAVMSASEQDWSQRTPVVWTTGYAQEQPSNDNRVNESRTILDDGQVARVTTAYEQNVKYNNPAEVAEYDYDLTLKRRSTTSYVTNNTTGGVTYNYRTDDAIHLLSLPSQRSVYDGTGAERARTVYAYDNYSSDGNNAALLDYGAVTGHDSAYGGTRLTRGNQTQVGIWNDTSNTLLVNYARFDVAGNIVSTKDARGNVSQVEYSSTYAYAYPTHTISAIPGAPYGSTTALETTTAYDFQTGLVTSSTDANNQVTTFEYDDPFHRPTKEVRPAGGGWTTNEYTTSAYGDRVHVRTLLNSSGLVSDSYQFSDGFGRTYRSFVYEGVDPNNVYLTTDTQFDALGRVWRVSNTYRSASAAAAINPSDNWTTTAYDSLSRVTSVKTADNAIVASSYTGNQVTVTDQAGKKRRSVTDALGRLTQVIEDPDGLAYQTDYLYDAMGNLRKVTQGTQTRYFMYDSLSHLIRARTPEEAVNANLTLTDPVTGNSQWSNSYAYDAVGNASSKTDARGVTSSFVFDSLNRNTEVNYSDGSNIRRYYDGATLGRGRAWVSYRNLPSGANSQTATDIYDACGRALSHRQQFYAGGSWGAAYTVSRTYDLAGNVLTQTYPSGHTVSYSHDRMNRTTSFGGNIGDGVSRTFMTALAFDDGGHMTREQFGTDTPLYHKRHYNVRGQLYDMRLSSVNDDSDWNRGAIVNYYSLANYGFGTSGADNNGNLYVQQHWIPGGGYTQQNYGYDALNRLSSVAEYQNGATNTGVQNYSYDRWGNRTIASTSSGTGINAQQFTVDAASNRLGVPVGQSGAMTYDASGNLINDTYTGFGSRTYDAENRMVAASDSSGGQSQYTYDADGLRVRRQTTGRSVWQVYGIDGELAAEYAESAAPSVPQKEYGYRNGELLITAGASSTQPSSINLAQGKAATQSSELGGAPASRAVDGNTSGNWANSSVTHTNYNTQAWWEVDLGSVQSIQSIKVWNRTDCCGDRLANFYVFVSDVPFTSTNLTATQNQAGVSSFYTVGQGGSPTTVTLNRTGRYVRVQLAGADYLSLAEVEVLGTPAPAAPSNLALNKTATQSSNPFGVSAGLAVDGNTDGSYYHWSVSSTDFDYQAWWQVDLGSVQSLSEVKVWNRTDCCGDRLSNFYVFVSDAPFSSTDLTATQNQAGVSSFYTVGQGGSPTTVTLNRTGRYVRVQLAGTNYLSLAEVQVFGAQGTAPPTTTSSGIQWLVTDHLGTPRMIADKSGSLSGIRRHDYLPFGEELSAGVGGRTTQQGYGQADNVRQRFTGSERDDETGLDYMQARYYGSTIGRFTSADPYDINIERQYEADDRKANALLRKYIGTPQHWNRYNYALNNPLRYVDPSGENEEEIVARVNIVYDKNTIKTEEAARRLTASTVADAIKTYATAGITLKVTYTAGTATGGGNVQASGLRITEGKVEGAVNVFVSENRLQETGGVSNPNTGESFINYGHGANYVARNPGDDILGHELGHQFGINSPASSLGKVGNFANNWSDDVTIDHTNALLRRGKTSEYVPSTQPMFGADRGYVRDVSRFVNIYREGAKKFAQR